jgi:hypothetical protein
VIGIPRLDWPVLDWVPAEQDNFDLLRDLSDESQILAAAVCDELSRWHPGPLAQLRLLDYGAEPDNRLAALLRDRVRAYLPVRLGGDTPAAQGPAGGAFAGQRLPFDAVLLSHVLPYIRRPDRVLSALAHHAEPDAIVVAVGLAPRGDQHELTLRARQYDAAYPRRHDHTVHLDRWLTRQGVPRSTRITWSQAHAEDEQTLRRLVEFMLGSADPGLIDPIAATVPRRSGGGAVIRTAHSVLAWPLRYHRINPPLRLDTRDPDLGLPPSAVTTGQAGGLGARVRHRAGPQDRRHRRARGGHGGPAAAACGNTPPMRSWRCCGYPPTAATRRPGPGPRR